MIAKVSVRCVFDRLYQENWLQQVTTKKGQSNWSIASLCSELVAKMAKDIGMTIRKGIVLPFLPCLVAFWGFHPYMFFHFLKCFFVTFLYSNLITRGFMIIPGGSALPKIKKIVVFDTNTQDPKVTSERYSVDFFGRGCGSAGT